MDDIIAKNRDEEGETLVKNREPVSTPAQNMLPLEPAISQAEDVSPRLVNASPNPQGQFPWSEPVQPVSEKPLEAKAVSAEAYVPIGVQRHSTRVTNVKLGLMAVSVLLVAALIVWPLTQSGKRNFKIAFDSMESTTNSKPMMVSPRFHGVDKNSQPFNLTADEALQENENRVILRNLNGDISLSDGGWLSLLSEKGIYQMTEKSLDLSGGVSVFLASGYEVDTPSARVEFDKTLAYGSDAVTVQGPLGTLKAQRFEVRENGNELYFDGRVNVIAVPGSGS